MDNLTDKLKKVKIGFTEDVETGRALDEKIKLIHIISKSGDRYGSEFVKLIDYAQANGIDAQGTKDIPLYIIQKFMKNSYTKPNAGAEVEPEPVK